MPTVAALPGHAFAGGFMLALACDYRVMNNRRGYCCLNEAEIGLPLTIGMTALVMAKLPGVALRSPSSRRGASRRTTRRRSA